MSEKIENQEIEIIEILEIENKLKEINIDKLIIEMINLKEIEKV